MTTRWTRIIHHRELVEVIAPLALYRQDLVLDYVKDLERNRDAIAYDGKRRRTTEDDLRMVVKDQKAHIANLEAQLLPHLLAPQAEQAEML